MFSVSWIAGVPSTIFCGPSFWEGERLPRVRRPGWLVCLILAGKGTCCPWLFIPPSVGQMPVVSSVSGMGRDTYLKEKYDSQNNGLSLKKLEKKLMDAEIWEPQISCHSERKRCLFILLTWGVSSSVCHVLWVISLVYVNFGASFLRFWHPETG